MQWKKITAPAGFAIAAAFLFMAPAGAAPNQLNEKFDVNAFAHWDTTFASAPSDTVHLGFRANKVSICVPSTSSAVITFLGKGAVLKSNSGGIFGNTRAGLSSFKSASRTPPASTCVTYDGAPMCTDIVITGTWTGVVDLFADRDK